VRCHVRRAPSQLRLLLFELRDLRLVAADLLVVALRLGRRLALPLLRLDHVGVLGARLHLGAVVLLRQEFRVGRRRDILVVVEIDQLLVPLPLRRRWGGHRRHGRGDHLRLGLLFLGRVRLLQRVGLGNLHQLGTLLVRLGRLLSLGFQRLGRRLDGGQIGRQLRLIGRLKRDVDLLRALGLLAAAVDPGRDHHRRDDVEMQQQGDQRAARKISACACGQPPPHESPSA
jgi:hypothetical protein